MRNLDKGDPLAVALTKAIREGDIIALERLLSEHDGLANVRIFDARGGSRTLLHVVTDWPGHFPNGVKAVVALVAAGANPNGAGGDPDSNKLSEAPLHWAASSDDVPVLDALLDAGANIETPGACIAGGTAIDNAVAFGQWHAARRLVERGTKTALWHVAALGLMDRVEEHFTGSPMPARYPWGKGSGEPLDEVTIAFWCACHGGQQCAAEYLLARGAKLNWVSVWDGLTPLDAASRSEAQKLVEWLRSRGGTSAKA